MEVTLKIKLSGGTPVSWLFIQDGLAINLAHDDGAHPGQANEPGSILLGGFHKEYISKYYVANPQRGAYGGEPVFVSYGDPFGFFKRTFRIPMEDAVFVHPARLTKCPDGALSVPCEEDINKEISQRSIGSSPYTERIREYLPGDSLRRIYWKGSARTGMLLTRIPEDDSASISRCLWLDTEPTAYAPEALWNKSREMDICASFELAVQAAAMLLRREFDQASDREPRGDHELYFHYGTMSKGLALSGHHGLRQGLDLLAGVRLEQGQLSTRYTIVRDAIRTRTGMIHTLITGRITAELVSDVLQLAGTGEKIEIWTTFGNSRETGMEAWLLRLSQAGIPYVDLSSYLTAQPDLGGDRHVSA
jgi:hypothetical protein